MARFAMGFRNERVRMKTNPREPKLVSTADLAMQAPEWLVLKAPFKVWPVWRDLISSCVKSAAQAFGACPPENLYLKVEQAERGLHFSLEFPSEFEERHPATVEALRAEADSLDRISVLLHDRQIGVPLQRDVDHSVEQLIDGVQSAGSERSPVCEPAEEAEDDRGDPVSVESPDNSLRSDTVVEVFTWDARPSGDGGRRRGRDADSATRIDNLMRRLMFSGTTRPLRTPVAEWSEQLDLLEDDFPNFASLIRAVIRPHLGLLKRGYMHRMNSVLLVGPPGIGKTHFAHELAKILNVGRPLFVPIAAETNASSLAGSSTFWSNSSPGALFERLAWGEPGANAVANPLVILDEVDKSVPDRYDPLGPLYSLLEAETARTFQDQSIPDLYIDASHVRFIATANDVSAIPAPLLSRTLVFHIAAPAAAQLQRIVQRIYQGIVDRIGVPMRAPVPAEILKRASELSPREAKVRLECAIAQAVCAERDRLVPGDWLDIDLCTARRQSIGFTTH